MINLYVDLYAEDGDQFESDSVDVVGYDRDSKTLYIEFQSSGDVYSYQGVTESTYNMLVTAPSVGSFVAKYIKGNGYGGEKFNDNHVIRTRGWDTGDQDETPETTTNAEAFPETEATAQVGIQVTDGDVSLFVPNARITVPEGVKSRYAVQWTIPGTVISGEPVYLAGSEHEALEDFAKDVETLLGGGVEVHVKAVVHYLD